MSHMKLPKLAATVKERRNFLNIFWGRGGNLGQLETIAGASSMVSNSYCQKILICVPYLGFSGLALGERILKNVI